MFIIMTPEQAEHVRGETAEGSALDPILTKDGGYFLPVEVLADNAHAVHHEYLAALPQAETVELPTVVEPVEGE